MAQVKPLVITQVVVKGLVPGIPQAIGGDIANPNDFDVTVSANSLTVSPSMDAAHTDCRFDTNFVLIPPTMSGSTIPATGTTGFGAGSIELLNLKGVDQQVCQGGVVTLSYTLGALS